MKAASQWNTFIHSGNVKDYLAFKAMEEEETRKKDKNSDGDRFYAGFCSSDRDGNQNKSCR